jgi:hypothetical protein
MGVLAEAGCVQFVDDAPEFVNSTLLGFQKRSMPDLVCTWGWCRLLNMASP